MAHRQDERISDFTALAWCNALLSDPSITHIRTREIMIQQMNCPIPLIATTLFTDDTIPAYLSLYRTGGGARRVDNGETGIPLIKKHVPKKPSAEMMRRLVEKKELVFDMNDPEVPEHIILCSLQKGLEGGVDRLHGGILSTLMDTSMGQLVFQFYGIPPPTIELKVSFKKVVETPGVYIVRAKASRQKGRWIDTRAWVEDGEGTVYAEAWAAFVVPKDLAAKM